MNPTPHTVLKTALYASLIFGLTAGAAHAATTVATVNGKAITLEDLNLKHQESVRFFPVNPPSKKTVLDELIKKELGVQEANRQGLAKTPEVIDRMNTVLFQALIEKSLGDAFAKIFISDSEAKAYYLKSPEIRTSHIFVGIPPGASQKIEKEAFERIKKIQDQYLRKEKMSFPEAAQRYSEGPTAPMGGDMDYQTKDRLDPAYYDTALGLRQPGAVSSIVRSQLGYHIIKLTAIRPWGEADKAAIKRLVFEDRRKTLYEKYLDELRKKAKVTINAGSF